MCQKYHNDRLRQPQPTSQTNACKSHRSKRDAAPNPDDEANHDGAEPLASLLWVWKALVRQPRAIS